MSFPRWFKHLCSGSASARRVFPLASMQAIEAAIRASEARHEGEICFAVEGGLDVLPLMRKQSARERAVEVFSELRVWDTEQNNGVLIYLLLADHDVEILADRGINAKVEAGSWETICRDMEQAFRHGRFEQGVITGINEISALLEQHYPKKSADANELPNTPLIL